MKLVTTKKVKEEECSKLYLNNKFTQFFALIIFTMTFAFSASATHVVGGGITYQQLENDNYLLTVKLYADCSPNTANIPNNVNVMCRRGPDGSNPAPFGNFVLPRISRDTLSPDAPSCTFDPGICVEEAIYQAVVTMPAGLGGYHLYYTICCRNGTIQNITNPLNAQETFYAYVPDRFVILNNSSPFFNDVPPVYVCAGEDLNLNFSASDYDGDQLVYSFYTPYDGQNNGGITYGPGIPPNNINISPVNWQAGFGATDPLDPAPGLLPGLAISNGGLITGTPTMPGQYVVGVMVDEYRNGELIGRITRDFQFNVLNCPPPNQAGIDIVTNCNGLDVDFLNTSTGLINNYFWNFGTLNPADTSLNFEPSFTFPNPGTYDITLIVEKGLECADTIQYQLQVENPVNFNLNIDSISCNGLSDGSAFATSIEPNYGYQWSTNETGNTISNLALGNYWAEATNTIGCLDTQFFVIEEPNILSVQFNENDPLCHDAEDGQVEAIVNGGTAPYTFFWPNENFYGNPLVNVGAGNHEVIITDANGCIISDEGHLDNPNLLSAYVSSQANTTCFGLADGSVTVAVNGGTPNYTIDWLTLQNDAFFMDGLSAGGYVAEVIDNNGCLASVVVNINEPDTFFVDVILIQDELCSDANGHLMADVTNGIGVIDYLWSNNATTFAITNLPAGNYSVTATDENGCQDTASMILIDKPAGVASVGNSTPVSCENGNDGTVDIAMIGGTAPFSYNWNCVCPDQANLTGLDAGYYWVEVTDANGCIDTLNFEIQEIAPLNISAVSVSSPLCNGDSNGQIQTASMGGTAPYAYVWNTNPPEFTPDINNVSAGDYTVTITDDNGCVSDLDVSVTEPDVLDPNAQILGNIICFGDSAGVASAQPQGGTAPFTYLWSNGETTQLVDSLGAGHYFVTVTDDNGCQTTENVEIIEYDQVTAQINFDEGFCPGDSVTFTVLTNGLNNQYDYFWLVNQVFQGQENTFEYPINDSVEISIQLVNTGNCPTVSDTVWMGPIFMDPNNLSVIGTPDTICFGGSAMIQGIIQDTSYLVNSYWNDTSLSGNGPHVVTPNQPTLYTYTIENMCGQLLNASTMIDVFMPPTAYVFGNGTEGCESVETAFGYSYDAYTYSLEGVVWTINGQLFDQADPTLVSTYSNVTSATAHMTFSNGCTFDFNELIEVEVYENPEANFYFNPDPAQQGEVTEFVDISHGNPQEWEWYLEGDFISTEERPSHVFEETGEYEVTQIIHNEYGCSDTMVHLVEVIGSYTVYVPNAFTPDGNGANNSFKPIMRDVVIDDYEFLIFDRWGEVIFSTEDLEGAWDGRYLGDVARDGVYIWKIIVTDNVGKPHELVGHVTLLR